MYSSWRRFQFFQKRVLPSGDAPPAAGDDAARLHEQGVPVVCAAAGRGQLVFGDGQGVVRVVDRDRIVTEFQAHDSVTHVIRVSHRNVLVTVGVDLERDLSPAAIKLWHMDQTEGDPVLAHEIRPFTSDKVQAAPITCVAVQDDLSHIAIGLGNGAVLLLVGDILRGRYKTYRLRHNGPCVTSVHFASSSVLFLTTTSSVSSVQVLVAGHPETMLDAADGCDMHCSAVSDTGALVVGRPSGIFFFELDDVGPCYGFESRKRSLHWFHAYLVTVSDHKSDPSKHELTVYDLRNKFIAFSGVFDAIAHVLIEWGALIVVPQHSPRKLIELTESDLTTKMDMLFKRNLFPIAISLAQSQALDQSFVMEIVKRYGDHLYEKGDYHGAMREYLDTVTPGTAYVEPSYVIRKYLDARLSDDLTAYLEALHSNSCATKLHTTLLLNCFTRAKLDEKLTAFLSNTKSNKFDVDNAIQVCMSAGYLDHALQLATKNGRTDAAIKILLAMGDFAAVCLFISKLPFEEAEACLRLHGHLLFEEAPEQTSALLERLCTEFAPSLDGKTKHRANPDEFIHLFVGRPDDLRKFLESIVAKIPNSSSTVYTTLLEVYLRSVDPSQLSSPGGTSDKILRLLSTQQTKYDPELALVLVKRYKFTAGVLFLYQKLKLYLDILEHHFQCNDANEILETCIYYGDEEPNLWLRALSYFADNARHSSNAESIQQVLRHIQETRLLPPLMVIQILSRNQSIPLAIVKDFLLQSLTYEQSLLDDDRRRIDEYRAETADIRAKIERLETQPVSFQATTCSECNAMLSEPPVIHFLCMHSYHERCMENMQTTAAGVAHCPICYADYKKIVEIDESMKASASDHEAFFHKLHDADDGFAAVAEYFGRGIVEGLQTTATTTTSARLHHDRPSI
ncbi:Vacuolar protein sorting-associated protein 11 like protein [Plasmodiophora brassicae]